jgi:hypothetical protein
MGEENGILKAYMTAKTRVMIIIGVAGTVVALLMALFGRHSMGIGTLLGTAFSVFDVYMFTVELVSAARKRDKRGAAKIKVRQYVRAIAFIGLLAILAHRRLINAEAVLGALVGYLIGRAGPYLLAYLGG